MNDMLQELMSFCRDNNVSIDSKYGIMVLQNKEDLFDVHSFGYIDGDCVKLDGEHVLRTNKEE